MMSRAVTKRIVHRLTKRLGVVLHVGEGAHHHPFHGLKNPRLRQGHNHPIEVIEVFVKIFEQEPSSL